MTRSWCIEYGVGRYHVLSSANERKLIFCVNEDKRPFLASSRDISARFEVDVFPLDAPCQFGKKGDGVEITRF